MPIDGFSQRWRDFPDYIIGITQEIWEQRGIGTLRDYYAPDLIVRTPMGISRGNAGVMAATMATLHEFPDRKLFADNVIWSDDGNGHLLSSHRIISTGTHLADGAFGAASGRKFNIRVIADCAARNDAIDDEWLVRDYGGLVRQLGLDPKAYAASLIDAEGGPEMCNKPYLPENDEPGPYTSRGNENEWGGRYADTLTRLMAGDFHIIPAHYDRAVLADYPGGVSAISHDAVSAFWLGLRSAFPNAKFDIHHQIGMDGDMLAPRAAIRWSLDGLHEGWGPFGRPTGVRVHVMGIAHAEYGPFTAEHSQATSSIRRETALYDEVAIWKQILMATGATS